MEDSQGKREGPRPVSAGDAATLAMLEGHDDRLERDAERGRGLADDAAAEAARWSPDSRSRRFRSYPILMEARDALIDAIDDARDAIDDVESGRYDDALEAVADLIVARSALLEAAEGAAAYGPELSAGVPVMETALALTRYAEGRAVALVSGFPSSKIQELSDV